MTYAILTAIGDMYRTEAGNAAKERFPVLEALAHRLQTHIALADKLKAEAHGSATVAPETYGPWRPGDRVKALVGFHEKATKKWSLMEKVNGEVAHLRTWLSRQGVHQTFDGKIIESQSARKVEYDSALETQGRTRITIRGGLLYLQDKPFDTNGMVTHFSGPGYAIYVMSKEGNFHVSSHAVGHRHHSSLLAGQNVAGAGEMRVQHGRLVYLSNKSGHYHPDIRHLFQTLGELQAQHVPMTFSVYKSPDKVIFKTVDDFMRDHQADNAAYEAQTIFDMVDKDNMPFFLKNHYLAFLSANANHGVHTTGFHIIRDGEPPYWQSPEQVKAMMIANHLPMVGSYVKHGAGR